MAAQDDFNANDELQDDFSMRKNDNIEVHKKSSGLSQMNSTKAQKEEAINALYTDSPHKKK